jgi:hypothetical protein
MSDHCAHWVRGGSCCNCGAPAMPLYPSFEWGRVGHESPKNLLREQLYRLVPFCNPEDDALCDREPVRWP